MRFHCLWGGIFRRRQNARSIATSAAQGIVEAILSCGSSTDLRSSTFSQDRCCTPSDRINPNASASIIQSLLRSGNLPEARRLFDQMPLRGVFLYTLFIGAYARGHDPLHALSLLRQMHSEGIPPNRITFVEALAACARIPSVSLGRIVHLWIAEAGLESDSVLGTALLNMYGKCGRLDQSRAAFDKIQRKDMVAWNAMILVALRNKQSAEALMLFRRMQCEGIRPNKVTLLTILSVFQSPRDLHPGKLVHGLVIESGLGSCLMLANAVVNMYAKCEDVDQAYETFSRIEERNVVTWNVMISAYAQLGDSIRALKLFHGMLLEGVPVENTTFINILNALNSSWGMKGGRLIRACAWEVEFDVIVATALVTMFGRCGSVWLARDVFEEIEVREAGYLIVWNAMVAAYVQHEMFEAAVGLFRRMLVEGIRPDSITFVSTVNACSSLEDFKLGRELHSWIIEEGLEAGIVLMTAVVDMYGKAGDVSEARRVFERISEPDLIAWNVLMGVYIMNGEAAQALELYHRMHLKPDRVTFITVLGAFATSSALPQGRIMHREISKRGLDSDVIVATALVDMYGKCGGLDEAFAVFEQTTGRNVVTWNALIAGCCQQGAGDEVPDLVRRMQQEGVDPDEITWIVALSACSHAGLLEAGCKFFAGLLEDGAVPVEEHLGCLVDLLGRAGKLAEAEETINRLKRVVQPSAAIWTSLLSACCVHSDIAMARRAAKQVVALDHEHTAAYVVLSNSMLQEGKRAK